MNPARLFVLLGDGARCRTNQDDDRSKRPSGGDAAGETKPSQKASKQPENDSSSETSDTGSERSSGRRGWRENKVGIVARMTPGSYDETGEYRRPKDILKTYVATMEDSHSFGRTLRTEAERRGIASAERVVFLSDNGHGMPDVAAREFPDAIRITDFYHSAERLASAAKAMFGEADDSSWNPRFRELRSLLWNGELDALIARLTDWAESKTSRPKSASALSSASSAKTLWTQVFYFERWRETMNYPYYRSQGFPIGSGAVESACGQFGDRVKHSRMRWSASGAESMHQLKAAILSEDGRWDNLWPAPIEILELPGEVKSTAISA